MNYHPPSQPPPPSHPSTTPTLDKIATWVLGFLTGLLVSSWMVMVKDRQREERLVTSATREVMRGIAAMRWCDGNPTNTHPPQPPPTLHAR